MWKRRSNFNQAQERIYWQYLCATCAAVAFHIVWIRVETQITSVQNAKRTLGHTEIKNFNQVIGKSDRHFGHYLLLNQLFISSKY